MLPSGRGPRLLVSVRSAEEAAIALAGGADVIDVKEPDHGSLGRAADHIIREVVDKVAGRRPVSAALGELVEDLAPCEIAGLTYVKRGLAGCDSSPEWWQNRLRYELSRADRPQSVVVAYADWQCARAPAVSDVVTLACEQPGRLLLIDTHCKTPATLTKQRSTLFDWLPAKEIVRICSRCDAAGVRVALAGSLDIHDMLQLLPAHPDWFAVRGAVCVGNDRQAMVALDKVRSLAGLLATARQSLPEANLSWQRA